MATTISNIINEAKKYLPNLNSDRVLRAYEVAKKAHQGQKRCSGEPYIKHPLEVTQILLSLRPDEDSIVTSLLHDVVEDTSVSLDELRAEFGESIVPLLTGVEKLNNLQYHGRERQVENLRKMFMAMAKDIRVILIKLADRLHNIQTLEHIPRADKRKRIAEETLSIYSPIASRLGIYKIKNELDTLCFNHLYPEEDLRFKHELRELTIGEHNVIRKGERILKETLKKEGVIARIFGRVKNPFSIYKKLKKKNKNYLSELYDIFALRIIVSNEAECYQVLGLIHKNWTPLSRRFKDYIALPKSNGYRSLHTTLIGLMPSLNNQPIEVQIRTEEMDRVAEFGIAAHWHYDQIHKKNTKREFNKNTLSSKGQDDFKLNWVKNLVDINKSLKSNNEFLETLNVDIFKDRIFTLTPKGDVIDLPYGATPIDFAYAIDEKIANQTKTVKINGQIAPLDHKLKNGQVVEISTDPMSQPNRFWLSFVVTSRAKSKIKFWFENQDKEKIFKEGKNMINQTLVQLCQEPLDTNLSILKNLNGEKLSVKEREVIVEKVGMGIINPIDLLKSIIPKEAILKREAEKEINKRALKEGVQFDEKPEILITGEKGFKTQIASCCEPSVENKIIGYVTKGRGVTIHDQKCKMLKGLDQKRMIRTSWSTQKMPNYEVYLQIYRRSRIGLLRDVAGAFASHQLPILEIENKQEKGGDKGYFIVLTTIDSIDTLSSLIKSIKNIDGVFSVKEIHPSTSISETS